MDSLTLLSKEDKDNILLLLHNYCIYNNINNNDNLKLIDFDKFLDKYSKLDINQIDINKNINVINDKIKKINNLEKQWEKASNIFIEKTKKNNILDEDEYNKRFYHKKSPSFSNRTGKQQKEYIDNKRKECNDKLEQYKNMLN